MDIGVRTVVHDTELDDIHALIRQLSSGAKLPDLASMNQMIAAEGFHFITARESSKTIAMLSLVLFQIPTGLRARIEDVVVLETHRRQGIARRMSTIAIEQYKDSGARTLDLTSSPSRAAANQLYVSLGFKQRETNVYRYTD